MNFRKNSHCSYCGNRFDDGQPWPRLCPSCGQTSYLNPLPVTVVLAPVDEGLLAVRRAIPPRQGQLALPGGFINLNETWQVAGAREVFEETGVVVGPNTISVFGVKSAPDGTVLIFGLAAPIRAVDLPTFTGSDEASERVVLTEPADLAFPLHTEAVRRYFDGRRVAGV